jgi:hypothetical protein
MYKYTARPLELRTSAFEQSGKSPETSNQSSRASTDSDYIYIHTPPTATSSIVNMPASVTKYKVAAVQSEPGWFNLEKSVQKTIDLINEAGQKGVKLIAFPETCMWNNS